MICKILMFTGLAIAHARACAQCIKVKDCCLGQSLPACSRSAAPAACATPASLCAPSSCLRSGPTAVIKLVPTGSPLYQIILQNFCPNPKLNVPFNVPLAANIPSLKTLDVSCINTNVKPPNCLKFVPAPSLPQLTQTACKPTTCSFCGNLVSKPSTPCQCACKPPTSCQCAPAQCALPLKNAQPPCVKCSCCQQPKVSCTKQTACGLTSGYPITSTALCDAQRGYQCAPAQCVLPLQNAQPPCVKCSGSQQPKVICTKQATCCCPTTSPTPSDAQRACLCAPAQYCAQSSENVLKSPSPCTRCFCIQQSQASCPKEPACSLVTPPVVKSVYSYPTSYSGCPITSSAQCDEQPACNTCPRTLLLSPTEYASPYCESSISCVGGSPLSELNTCSCAVPCVESPALTACNGCPKSSNCLTISLKSPCSYCEQCSNCLPASPAPRSQVLPVPAQCQYSVPSAACNVYQNSPPCANSYATTECPSQGACNECSQPSKCPAASGACPEPYNSVNCAAAQPSYSNDYLVSSSFNAYPGSPSCSPAPAGCVSNEPCTSSVIAPFSISYLNPATCADSSTFKEYISSCSNSPSSPFSYSGYSSVSPVTSGNCPGTVCPPAPPAPCASQAYGMYSTQQSPNAVPASCASPTYQYPSSTMSSYGTPPTSASSLSTSPCSQRCPSNCRNGNQRC